MVDERLIEAAVHALRARRYVAIIDSHVDFFVHLTDRDIVLAVLSVVADPTLAEGLR